MQTTFITKTPKPTFMTSKSSVMPRTIGGLIEDIFQNGLTRMWSDDRLTETSSDYAPVNIQDTETGYEMFLMAPGLKKDDFKLAVDRNVFTISYDHKEDAEAADGKWLRNEYKMRSFKRSFTLNEKIDATTISARYTDGVLNITLPKKVVDVLAAQEISVS